MNHKKKTDADNYFCLHYRNLCKINHLNGKKQEYKAKLDQEWIFMLVTLTNCFVKLKTGLPTLTSFPMCLWCSAETSSWETFFVFCSVLKFFLPFAYLLFTSQLPPTALKQISSSSSHCYGEQDCSSPTRLIFVLELTSVGMANITFRQQEQVVLNRTLYSFTAVLLKCSNFYFHCDRDSLVTAPVHICTNYKSELSSLPTTPCIISYKLHYSHSCFVYWITWQSSSWGFMQLCFFFSVWFPFVLLNVPSDMTSSYICSHDVQTVCLLLWNLRSLKDRIITLQIIDCVFFVL